MKTFHAVLANSLIASLTNTFVWVAVTFWVYLQTESVIATSVMAGVYLGITALSGFFLGALVDRLPKKTVLLLGSGGPLLLYMLAALVYTATPERSLADPTSVMLWLFITLTLIGAIMGNVRVIALSTLVTILVAPEARDRSNGLVGTANGIAFLVSTAFSGLAIGFLGMFWALVIAIVITILVILHVWSLTIPEPERHPDAAPHEGVDIRGTILAIGQVPGLFGLLFFNTFNNFLGGVFMSLMDAYGLELVSVQAWGLLWSVLSLGFIVGGLVVTKKGLGATPLRTLFVVNIVMWTICIFFAIQASVWLLAVGMFIYMCLVPVVEAAEQTILQTIIPLERQGRVFGFAQSTEQAASPLTAFAIGPIAQFMFIPFMTTGAGVQLLGPWFGTGKDRGIALVFIIAGIIGLIVTFIAMRSYAYRVLSQKYRSQVALQQAA